MTMKSKFELTEHYFNMILKKTFPINYIINSALYNNSFIWEMCHYICQKCDDSEFGTWKSRYYCVFQLQIFANRIADQGIIWKIFASNIHQNFARLVTRRSQIKSNEYESMPCFVKNNLLNTPKIVWYIFNQMLLMCIFQFRHQMRVLFKLKKMSVINHFEYILNLIKYFEFVYAKHDCLLDKIKLSIIWKVRQRFT